MRFVHSTSILLILFFNFFINSSYQFFRTPINCCGGFQTLELEEPPNIDYGIINNNQHGGTAAGNEYTEHHHHPPGQSTEESSLHDPQTSSHNTVLVHQPGPSKYVYVAVPIHDSNIKTSQQHERMQNTMTEDSAEQHIRTPRINSRNSSHHRRRNSSRQS